MFASWSRRRPSERSQPAGRRTEPRLEKLEDRTLLSVALIDFDDAPAPDVFSGVTALRDRYADQGVYFYGPAERDGGAIIDQDGNFGVPALSGRNFLAFNRNPAARMADGGLPTDPEVIFFDRGMDWVEISAAGADNVDTFEMYAYDAEWNFVSSNTVTTRDWSPLGVASDSANITYVVLQQFGNIAWVYDNLYFSDGLPAPEFGGGPSFSPSPAEAAVLAGTLASGGNLETTHSVPAVGGVVLVRDGTDLAFRGPGWVSSSDSQDQHFLGSRPVSGDQGSQLGELRRDLDLLTEI